MALKEYFFVHTTDNTGITTANSDDNGGPIMSQASFPGTGGYGRYRNNAPLLSGFSWAGEFQVISGSSPTVVGWSDTLSNTWAASFYVYITAYPSVGGSFGLRSQTSTAGQGPKLYLTTTGKIQIVHAGGTVTSTGTSVPLSTWFRLEMQHNGNGTTATMNAAWYSGHSATSSDAITTGSVAATANCAELRYGNAQSNQTANYNYRLAAVRQNIGSATALGPAVLPAHVETINDDLDAWDSGEVFISEFAADDYLNATDSVTAINPITQTADTDPHPVRHLASGTPINNSYVTILESASNTTILKGSRFRIYNAGVLKEATVFTVTARDEVGFGFRNVYVTPNFATTAVGGDEIRTDSHEVLGTAAANKTAAAAATQTQTATQSGSASLTRNAVADQTLTATQNATASVVRAAAASQTLTATQSAADVDIANATATAQTLTATMAADAVDIANATATQTLTATGTATATKTAAGVATQTLTATGTATANVTRAGAATATLTATGAGAATKTAVVSSVQNVTATANASATPVQTATVDVQPLIATGTATAAIARQAAGTSALTATGAASASVTRAVAGTQTLTLTSNADAENQQGVGATQTINATGTAAATKTVPAATTQALVGTQSAAASVTRSTAGSQVLTATAVASTSNVQTVTGSQNLIATQSAAAVPTHRVDGTQTLTATMSAGAAVTRSAAAQQALVGTQETAVTLDASGDAAQTLVLTFGAAIDGTQFLDTHQDATATSVASTNTNRQGNIAVHALTASQTATARITRAAETSQAVNADQFAEMAVIHSVDAASQTITVTTNAVAEAFSQALGDAVQLVVSTQIAAATVEHFADTSQALIATQMAGGVKTKFAVATQSVVATMVAESHTGPVDEDTYFEAALPFINLLPEVWIDFPGGE